MKILKKISLIIIGILLSLIVLEAGLQIAGLTITEIKKYRNKTTKDPNTITILCLGESTTDGQWPPILQKILDKKSTNKKFNIIDEGIGATNTRIISEKLFDKLIKYNPDAIIMMIGINDNGLNYQKYKLKTLSLFSLITSHIKQIFYYTEEDIEYLNHLIRSLPNYKLLNIMYRIYNKTGILNYHFIFVLNEYLKETNYKNKFAIKVMEQIINDKPCLTMFDMFAIIEYLENGKKYNKEQIKDFIIKNKHKIEYAEIETFRFLKKYDLLYILNDIQNNKPNKLNFTNIKKSKTLKKEVTKKNYQNILFEINKNNKDTLIFPMQYPMLPIKTLKDDLKDSPYYNKLIFISNEENFKQALKTHKIEEIFTDRFAGDFGHCTELGNTLIAENVAETILKLYN